MEILNVNGVKKTYTTRFGGNQVQALKGVTKEKDLRRSSLIA